MKAVVVQNEGGAAAFVTPGGGEPAVPFQCRRSGPKGCLIFVERPAAIAGFGPEPDRRLTAKGVRAAPLFRGQIPANGEGQRDTRHTTLSRKARRETLARL